MSVTQASQLEPFAHEPFTHAPWATNVEARNSGELLRGAPPFPHEFVPRAALVDRLTETRRVALALIVAPAGFGKSALLAEWAAHDERPFLWLGLAQSEPTGTVIEHLADVLAPLCEEDGGCVVVLDDAELLEPELLYQAVQLIWKRLPPESVLALASRTEPALPLGRLRAHRALVEVRMRDLAMAPPEATTLLRQAGFELESESVDRLVELTEGWPAALYLAALSLREHRDDPSETIAFRGDDHLLGEYLRDEVLDRLPDELRSFLCRASVMEEVTGGLCDAVLKRHGSGTTLARVAQLTELLEPLDAAHEWYRWHPLLRESLSAELRRGEPELKPCLHGRASRWYSEHGDIDHAIAHAAAAYDAERTGELLWRHIVPYLARCQVGRVKDWLSAFNAEVVATNPMLAMCAAHTALMSGDAEAARRLARDATVAVGSEALPQSFAAGLAVIEAMAPSAGPAGMQRSAESARRSEPENSPWQPICGWLEGVAWHLQGEDRLAAARLLEETAESAGHAFPAVAVLARAQRAMIAMEDQDWELALDLTDETSAVIAESRLEEPIMALALAAAAAARAHEGRADEAKGDLRAGIDALTDLGDSLTWYGAETRILLAHASLYVADVVGARTLLAQASRLGRRTAPTGICQTWFDGAWSYLDTLAETSLTGVSSLTIAELRVLRFLPSCRPFREIAGQLGVSSNTVKTQARAVYRKLGAVSRSDAVARARSAGLLGQ